MGEPCHSDGFDDDPMRILVVTQDVTRFKTDGDKLRESEERYRVVAEAIRDMIFEMDAEGRLIYASPTVFEVLGYQQDERTGTTLFGLIHSDDIERVRNAFLKGVESNRLVQTTAHRIQHRDGSWRWVEGVIVPYQGSNEKVRFLGVMRDITEARRAEKARLDLENRVLRAQKFESWGVMASGIAHDFNNLLTPILGDASLALMDIPSDSPARKRLQCIQKSAAQAAALTNQMLVYSGNGPIESERLDLSQLVAGMGQLLETAISRETIFKLELQPDLPAFLGDSAQISQLVINLITNAAEALDSRCGKISLRTGSIDAAQVESFLISPDEETLTGTYVYVDVIDTGCGMNAETYSKIFEPFYSTKFMSRGLGLVAVLGIVRSHQGTVEIESEPGEGTRFRVLFPACRKSIAETPEVRSGVFDWRTSGVALVVDDDEGIREIAAETLKRIGLTVLCACDGREGIDIFRQHGDQIRAVLLDRTMPNVSGEEAFDEMHRLRPSTPIILVSGYGKERVAEHWVDRGLAGFLQKPFLPEALLAMVRNILEPNSNDRAADGHSKHFLTA